MTRLCRACEKRKTLDQFDFSRYTPRCLECSEAWEPALVKLRVLLREHGTVEAVAEAIGYAPSTTAKYLRAPETITPRASQRIRKAQT